MCNSLFRMIWIKLTKDSGKMREEGEKSKFAKEENKNGKQFVTVCRFKIQLKANQASYLLTR